MSIITVKGRLGTQSISHNSLRLINTRESLSCPSASVLVSDSWKQSTVSGISKKGKNVVGEIYVPAHQAHGIYGPRTERYPDSCRGACCLFLAKSKINSAGLGILDNQLFVYSSIPMSVLWFAPQIFGQTMKYGARLCLSTLETFFISVDSQILHMQECNRESSSSRENWKA